MGDPEKRLHYLVPEDDDPTRELLSSDDPDYVRSIQDADPRDWIVTEDPETGEEVRRIRVRDLTGPIVDGLDAGMGASRGGNRSAEVRRERAERRNAPMLREVRRLRASGLRPGEIVDQLLDRYGRRYDPDDGDDYDRARKALAEKIRQAEKVAAGD